jgi:hypothetical protein
MVGAVVKALRDRVASDFTEPGETAGDATDTAVIEHPKPKQHHNYPKSADRERIEAERALNIAAHEQERLAQALGKFICFYKHGDETLGPVTLWNVRELVEADLLTPDVPVILEGSDYWFSYAQQELRIAPPAGANKDKLRMAGRLFCFYMDNGKESGPLSLLGIFHLIRSGRLAPDVQVRTDGSAEWKSACEI